MSTYMQDFVRTCFGPYFVYNTRLERKITEIGDVKLCSALDTTCDVIASGIID